MRISLDNGKTWHDAENVIISKLLQAEEHEVEMVWNFHQEEVKTDIIYGNQFLGSDSQSYQELGDKICQ